MSDFPTPNEKEEPKAEKKKQLCESYESSKIICSSICKYYKDGICPFGETCRWFHPSKKLMNAMIPCIHHINGDCKRGKKCRFSHVMDPSVACQGKLFQFGIQIGCIKEPEKVIEKDAGPMATQSLSPLSASTDGMWEIVDIPDPRPATKEEIVDYTAAMISLCTEFGPDKIELIAGIVHSHARDINSLHNEYELLCNYFNVPEQRRRQFKRRAPGSPPLPALREHPVKTWSSDYRYNRRDWFGKKTFPEGDARRSRHDPRFKKHARNARMAAFPDGYDIVTKEGYYKKRNRSRAWRN